MSGTKGTTKRRGARPGLKRVPVEDIKREMIRLVAEGHKIDDVCRIVDRSRITYEGYRRNDPVFASMVDRARLEGNRAFVATAKGRGDGIIPFPEFSEKYLHHRVFPHMLNVVDLVEGREPRWRHPAMTFNPGQPDLVIVNMPPEHGKSTTLTINYATYRINQDPNIRIIIVSKTAKMASKFLYAIKTRLTSDRFRQMHADYGPPQGWDSSSESWSQEMIYVSADVLDSGEKDPTVQAIGIGGHIYGARADLILIDDAVDLRNAGEFEKQIEWIQSEVMSRLSASGMLLMVGTRLAARDLYSEIQDPRRYPDEVSPWTYLAMPAVLEPADDPAKSVTLWPRSNQPELGARGEMAEPDADGLFPKWDGKRLATKRSRMQARNWAMVYQQQALPEDAVFSQEAVTGVINRNRLAGLIPEGMPGCRPGGMTNMVVVAGLDPAMVGHTAAVAIGLDLATYKRYVLSCWNQPSMSPDAIRELFYEWTERFHIVEWRVEKNAFQSMLTQDREINQFLTARGAILREHHTGVNKWQPDFGVASLQTLFQGWDQNRAMIELPSTQTNEAVKSLVEQLVTWMPEAPKGHKTDLVMALWFAELACRDRVLAMSSYSNTHARNPFATPYDKRGQVVASLARQDMYQYV